MSVASRSTKNLARLAYLHTRLRTRLNVPRTTSRLVKRLMTALLPMVSTNVSISNPRSSANAAKLTSTEFEDGVVAAGASAGVCCNASEPSGATEVAAVVVSGGARGGASHCPGGRVGAAERVVVVVGVVAMFAEADCELAPLVGPGVVAGGGGAGTGSMSAMVTSPSSALSSSELSDSLIGGRKTCVPKTGVAGAATVGWSRVDGPEAAGCSVLISDWRHEVSERTRLRGRRLGDLGGDP